MRLSLNPGQAAVGKAPGLPVSDQTWLAALGPFGPAQKGMGKPPAAASSATLAEKMDGASREAIKWRLSRWVPALREWAKPPLLEAASPLLSPRGAEYRGPSRGREGEQPCPVELPLPAWRRLLTLALGTAVVADLPGLFPRAPCQRQLGRLLGGRGLRWAICAVRVKLLGSLLLPRAVRWKWVHTHLSPKMAVGRCVCICVCVCARVPE